MFKIRIFQGYELQREKQKDYRNIVILQTIIIVSGLTLSEFVLNGTHTPMGKLVKIIEVADRRSYLLVIHCLLFLIEVTVIGFAIRDIFTGDYLTPDKLWGGDPGHGDSPPSPRRESFKNHINTV